MEKGSKRAGSGRDKGGNSFKKEGRSNSSKAYTKRDSSKPESESGGFKRSYNKSTSSAEDRPKRSFDGPKKTRENDSPRKPWSDRDSDKPYKAGASRSFDKPGRDKGDAPDKGRARDKKSFDKPTRSFDKREGDDRPARPRRDEGAKRTFDKPTRSFDKREGDDRPARPRRDEGAKRTFDKPTRSFDKREGDDRPARPRRDEGAKRTFDKPTRSFDKRDGDDRPARPRKDDGAKRTFDKPTRSFDKREGDDRSARPRREEGTKRTFDTPGKPGRPRRDDDKKSDSRPFRERTKPAAPRKKKDEDEDAEPVKREFKSHKIFEKEADFDKPQAEDVMPLNKFIAHSGECSRRDAAELVRQGKVKVNGELVLDPGQKVNISDDVTLIGKKLKPQKGMVYILLNKPKGFITTNEDPQGRKTVMDLVANSGVDRLFAVGRLDRNTTGLLLMTNDGILAQKLAHPSYQIKKVYQVTLDKPITKADFDKVISGVTLEDGIAHVDALAHLEAKNELGLEIHSGRNRIVRRIFESLGYEVEKLDRVMYAGLTKKNLPRSKWRFLDEREIVLLKHFKS
jgi:23S rRNA pseudouridine2605 synthase